MLGREELALLPIGATIVNIARGSIINETALYEALRDNRLRAGLDVWYNYPKDDNIVTATPPSVYPFHELENVVMTPHLGHKSDLTNMLRIRELAAMLNALAEGKPLPNRVDTNSGY